MPADSLFAGSFQSMPIFVPQPACSPWSGGAMMVNGTRAAIGRSATATFNHQAATGGRAPWQFDALRLPLVLRSQEHKPRLMASMRRELSLPNAVIAA